MGRLKAFLTRNLFQLILMFVSSISTWIAMSVKAHEHEHRSTWVRFQAAGGDGEMLVDDFSCAVREVNQQLDKLKIKGGIFELWPVDGPTLPPPPMIVNLRRFDEPDKKGP